MIRMLQAITKKLETNVVFSQQGQKELEDLFGRVVHLTDNLVAAFELSNEEHLAAIKEDANGIIAMEEQMRFSHIRRLHAQISVTGTRARSTWISPTRCAASPTIPSSLSRTCPASQANLP